MSNVNSLMKIFVGDPNLPKVTRDDDIIGGGGSEFFIKIRGWSIFYYY